MDINSTTFNKLVKEFPSVVVYLEWSLNEGSAKIEDQEFETSSFFIQISLNVSETGINDSGDYFTPPSFTSNGITVEEVKFKLFSKNTDEEVFLTEDQEIQFKKNIVANVITR